MNPDAIRLEALRLALTSSDSLNTTAVLSTAAAYADFLAGKDPNA